MGGHVYKVELTPAQADIIAQALANLLWDESMPDSAIHYTAEAIPFVSHKVQEYQRRNAVALLEGKRAGSAEAYSVLRRKYLELRALLGSWSMNCKCPPAVIGDLEDRTVRALDTERIR